MSRAVAVAAAAAAALVALLAVSLRDTKSEATPAAVAKPCAADALVPSFGEHQGVNSVTTLHWLVVRSRARSACTIRAAVTFEIGRGATGPVVVQPSSGTIFGPARLRTRLPAGGRAHAAVLVVDDCSNVRVPPKSIELRVLTGNGRSKPTSIYTCPTGTHIQVGSWQS
jgi:hypothetical protein